MELSSIQKMKVLNIVLNNLITENKQNDKELSELEIKLDNITLEYDEIKRLYPTQLNIRKQLKKELYKKYDIEFAVNKNYFYKILSKKYEDNESSFLYEQLLRLTCKKLYNFNIWNSTIRHNWWLEEPEEPIFPKLYMTASIIRNFT
jgi:hypothetical protein